MSTTATTKRGRWFAPTLGRYRREWLLPDLLAGVAAGAVVIPQAMAYSTIANLPVQVGIYTCILPMLVYAALGGSRAMSVSTTSTIATLTATTMVTAGVAVGSDDAVRDLATLTILVGLILVIARLLRLGSLVEYISEATLTGIKVGVGATVAVGQIPKLLGVETDFTGHGFIRSINAIVVAIPETNVPTLILSAGAILVLLLMGRLLPRVPGQLVVVAASILLMAFVLGPDHAGIDLIAEVPSGFSAPPLPSLTHLTGMVGGALGIAVMAFLESAAVARALRQAGDDPIDSNRELLGTGAASLVGGFLGAMPAAGGFSQSAVNQRAGAKSQLAAITTAVLAVLVALFLGPVLSYLPEATLAAMVIVAVLPLINPIALVRLWRISRPDFWVAAVTAALGLSAGLLPAVAVGVVLTLILVLRELGRTRIAVVAESPGELRIRIEGGLFTANVSPTLQAIEDEAEKRGYPDRVVLDVTAQIALSVTVLDAFVELDRELRSGGSTLAITGLPDAAVTVARRTAWYRGLEASGLAGPDVT